jgi:hypothetical protein
MQNCCLQRALPVLIPMLDSSPASNLAPWRHNPHCHGRLFRVWVSNGEVRRKRALKCGAVGCRAADHYTKLV